MKKILVTGATGFLGNYVIEYLLGNDYSVVASSSSRSKAMQKKWFEHVTYIPFDLGAMDPEKNYFTFFQKPDVVIHLAWEGLPNYKSDFHMKVNLPRQSAFLKNMIDNGLSDITVTGTCFEYGMQEGCLREDMEVHPSNPYGEAKNDLRVYLEQLQKKDSFAYKWVRLFYMYGEGQNSNSLLSQLDKALKNNDAAFNMSGGQQVRDYLPVKTVAEYIVKIALQDKVDGVINCCSGRPVTIEEFVRNYLREKNENITLNLGYYPYADYEPMRFWGENLKLKTILNDK